MIGQAGRSRFVVSEPRTLETNDLDQAQFDRLRDQLRCIAEKARNDFMAVARETNDLYQPSYIADLSNETQKRIMDCCGAHVMLFVRQSVINASIEAANKHLDDARLREEPIKKKTKSKQKLSKIEVE